MVVMADWKNIFESHLVVEGPLTADVLAQVPAKRGVLLLTDEHDVPITMITAGGLRQRLASRLAEPPDDAGPRRSADLREITRHVWWTLTSSHFETDWRFLDLAPKVWPKRFGEMLSSRKPWFVHVTRDSDSPQFARTHEPARGSRAFGPFPTGKSADHFIQILVEAFGLCRQPQRLPQAPHAHSCAYWQMGKCHGVCEGKIVMENYRDLLDEAITVAGGDEESIRIQWVAEMKRASKELAFEAAARVKNRLERLDGLSLPEFAQTAPIETFKYLIFQPGPSRKEVRAFFVVGPTITDGGVLASPFEPKVLKDAIKHMNWLAETFPIPDELAMWRVGLVSKYLYSSPERRGVMHRWCGDETPEDLTEMIRSGADVLSLGKRARAAFEKKA
jgi:excinuclease UvrABC nuclease subunit